MYCTNFYYVFTLTEQSKTGAVKGENMSEHLNTGKLNLPLTKYARSTRENCSLASRISSHPGSQMGL